MSLLSCLQAEFWLLAAVFSLQIILALRSTRTNPTAFMNHESRWNFGDIFVFVHLHCMFIVKLHISRFLKRKWRGLKIMQPWIRIVLCGFHQSVERHKV